MKKIILTYIFILQFIAFGQTVNVSGTVYDSDYLPVIGATITIQTLDIKTKTDLQGNFDFNVPPNDSYDLLITSGLYEPSVLNINVRSNNIIGLKTTLKNRMLGSVDVTKQGTGGFIDGMELPEPDRMVSATDNIEDFIKVAGLGVSTNNELTANYNVRGGNYDENLIYVNGIEIYRPFLARSGQQEGLSFINSALVENINFSSGGFDANYGDKLSSVLDIKYREPNEFKGSAQASLMGAQAHLEGQFAGRRGNYITGARYRSNSYLLNGLPTEGDYNPVFFDYQFLSNFYLDVEDDKSSYKKLFLLGHYSSNNYRFEPESQTTNWGTVNEAYQLRVFFEGEEETKFQTFTAATGYEILKKNRLKLSFVASAYHSIESEKFDILAEYWINELETDPAKEEFSDSVANVGVGGLLDHARNNLNVWIANAYHNGSYNFINKENEEKNRLKTADLSWGAKIQYENFQDQLSEWSLIDSSGYSIPLGSADEVDLKEVIKQNNKVETYRVTSYLQFTRNYITRKKHVIDLKKKIKTDSSNHFIYYKDTIISPSKLSITIGERLGYRFYNNELWFTPRMNITYTPRAYFLNEDSTYSRRNLKLRFASGLYYQPPLYRTMRGIDGGIVPDIVSQKSWHNVIGADVFFKMWGRPFKFVTEAYYKYMWDVVPYEIDNVRIRYYGENSAVAYAYGVDAKINGQFVPGVESFFRIGYLNTKEDISNDDYYLYLNSSGDTIRPGYTFDNVPVDSLLQVPGYIRRPTDQRVTFSLFFQDKMPAIENLKVSVNLILASNLPYGPPTFERYKDVLKTRPYYRVDLGFMYDLINQKNKANFKEKAVLKHLNRLTISLDAFNLLGIANVVSYQWLQDISGQYYSIPNHLTGRRINLRLVVNF